MATRKWILVVVVVLATLLGMGANGHYIVVLPAIDLVIAHKVDFDEDGRREVQSHEFDAILQMVIASACTGDCR